MLMVHVLCGLSRTSSEPELILEKGACAYLLWQPLYQHLSPRASSAKPLCCFHFSAGYGEKDEGTCCC